MNKRGLALGVAGVLGLATVLYECIDNEEVTTASAPAITVVDHKVEPLQEDKKALEDTAYLPSIEEEQVAAKVKIAQELQFTLDGEPVDIGDLPEDVQTALHARTDKRNGFQDILEENGLSVNGGTIALQTLRAANVEAVRMIDQFEVSDPNLDYGVISLFQEAGYWHARVEYNCSGTTIDTCTHFTGVASDESYEEAIAEMARIIGDGELEDPK